MTGEEEALRQAAATIRMRDPDGKMPEGQRIRIAFEAGRDFGRSDNAAAEQRLENDAVRRMQSTGFCPTCGSEA